MQQAIDFEIRWQIEQIEDGLEIQQATVLFDPDTGETRAMRTKEDAADYRYFPDPDLPPLVIDPSWIERIRAEMPESQEAMRARLLTQYGLAPDTAKLLVSDKPTVQLFEDALAVTRTSANSSTWRGVNDAQIVANWTLGKLSAYMNFADLAMDKCPVTAQAFGHLLSLVLGNKITPTGADTILREHLMIGSASMPEEIDTIVRKLDLAQISDTGAIEKVVDDVLAASPLIVAEVKAGKEKAFNALVGKIMAATRGKANPAQVNAILKQKLGT
jgi:aspartyl-tRNA(Asn)/glutamyl-tRNA(Gln) amidotransferase subunit B